MFTFFSYPLRTESIDPELCGESLQKPVTFPKLAPLKETFALTPPFYPILASGLKFNPRNIQYIHPVIFFVFLEFEQNRCPAKVSKW